MDTCSCHRPSSLVGVARGALRPGCSPREGGTRLGLAQSGARHVSMLLTASILLRVVRGVNSILAMRCMRATESSIEERRSVDR